MFIFFYLVSSMHHGPFGNYIFHKNPNLVHHNFPSLRARLGLRDVTIIFHVPELTLFMLFSFDFTSNSLFPKLAFFYFFCKGGDPLFSHFSLFFHFSLYSIKLTLFLFFLSSLRLNKFFSAMPTFYFFAIAGALCQIFFFHRHCSAVSVFLKKILGRFGRMTFTSPII